MGSCNWPTQLGLVGSIRSPDAPAQWEGNVSGRHPLLQLHGRQVHTFFELMGSRENDMTFALGWCLARAPEFLRAFCRSAGAPEPGPDPEIRLQTREAHSGITDVEIADGTSMVIVEAKRGWAVPTKEQLALYARRLHQAQHPPDGKRLVTLSAATESYLAAHPDILREVEGVPVVHLSWLRIMQTARDAAMTSGHAPRRLLREFASYLKPLLDMQNKQSNWVYVVSLGRDTFGSGDISFVDVVEKHNMYFHPMGNVAGGGWPKQAPNYIAFRYDGRLQSIHHAESWEIITNFAAHFDGCRDETVVPHLLYRLGPAMCPNHVVRTGASIRNASGTRPTLDSLCGPGR
jgi:hypothetical protein